MIRRPPRSTLFPYNDALPICPESIPTVRGYGFRPSPLSRLGRNDELKELTSNNTFLLPAARFLRPGVAFRSEEHTSQLHSPNHLLSPLPLQHKTLPPLYLTAP